MITADYARMMARYNAWQNRSLYGAADALPDEARRLDRGAFFKSIHGTLSHLAFGDAAWLARFTGAEPPKIKLADSPHFIDDWSTLNAERIRLDQAIGAFAAQLTNEWLGGDLTWWSGSVGANVTKPRWVLVAHMFNHQTHHRGQVHAMLTAAGAKPDATDSPFMPEAA